LRGRGKDPGNPSTGSTVTDVTSLKVPFAAKGLAMPELPDMKVCIESLQTRITGQPIGDIRLKSPSRAS
jgi:hypothetical protein